MSRRSKLRVTILIVAVSVTVALAVKFFLGLTPRDTRFPDEMRAKGNKNAPIRITEFIDLECPACARGAEYLARMMAMHPEAIRLDLKYFPLPGHRHGFSAARYTECAARQGRFWPFHDALLSRQANWSRLLDATPAFALIAQEVAIDKDKLSACLNDKSVDALIQQSRLEGARRGVRSTPTYYVNGKMVVGMQSLESELERLLSEIKK
ncbi:MAG: thioredoxin domain-containing protein [Candidatus Omnitrophica bacterium]|nr:thioredoxin domain-containing protein [Candidatus Omnitrophota bacterium]